MYPAQAVEMYESELTDFEKSELFQFNAIYTVGSHRVQNLAQISSRSGQYRLTAGEQIGYRFQVESVIDAGSFG